MSTPYATLYSTLNLSNSNGILTVTLNRPEIKNAFNETMIDDLDQLFQKEVLDPGVRVIVIQGAGDIFCAGGDLNWMKRSAQLDPATNLKDTLKLTYMFKRMNECPKPIIAAVHGAALGGGVGMISVADIVVAEKETTFSLSEVKLGIVPACIGPFVISKIGASNARSLFLSAKRFKGEEALRVGLVHEVCDGKEATQAKAHLIAENILQCGPNAVAIAKKMVLDLSWPERREQIPSCYDFVSETLANLRVTPEAQEGLSAFLEKRKPKW